MFSHIQYQWKKNSSLLTSDCQQARIFFSMILNVWQINLYNLRIGKFIITITTFEALKYLLEDGYNWRVWSDISFTFFPYIFTYLPYTFENWIPFYYSLLSELEFRYRLWYSGQICTLKFALLNLNVSTWNSKLKLTLVHLNIIPHIWIPPLGLLVFRLAG